jgi:hypothetical protein
MKMPFCPFKRKFPSPAEEESSLGQLEPVAVVFIKRPSSV